MSSAPTDTHKTFLADLARLVGPSHLLTDPAKTQRYRKGFRSGQGEALAVTLCGWYAFAGAVLLFQHYFVGPVYTIYK
jgi:hypothetical protein